MYELFFHLTAKPFSLAPDPRFLFLSKTHQKALAYLDYGMREGAGFILLTGEVGAGKTTLVKDFIERLDQSAVLATIFNTNIDGNQLVAAINEEFGLEIAGRDKLALQRNLNDFLIAQYAAGVRPVLMIDEAQNLSAESLEEVRLLSNLETGNSKLLQIVLIGQPELQQTLDQHSMRQLRQRIGISCHLSALSANEVADYIFYRLDKAGNRDAVTFDDGAIEVIHRYSGGIPRLVNRICDFLLLAAFGEGTRHLTLDLVTEVAAETGDIAAGSGAGPATGEQSEVTPMKERLRRLEEDFACLLSGTLEKERFIERMTLFENALKRMHNLLRDQSDAIDKRIDRIMARIDEMEKGRGLAIVK
jgi:putative secretion ATPase (PEP-CTERM system associated)